MGKSTLLTMVYSQFSWGEKHPQIKIWNWLNVAYFVQNDQLKNADLSIIDRYVKHVKNHWHEHRITSTLSRLGIEHVHLDKKVSDLSYGQRVKLRFLAMTSQEYDLLILDEPTNHLDISTREALENMLNAYPGAILIVSHDKRFAASINVSDIWRIDDRGIIVEPII